MSARPAGGRGFVASAVGVAVDWLVEPAERAAPLPPADVVVERLEERPVIAVVGLRSRCGTTVVARSLAAELASHDATGAAAVTATELGGGGVPLGLPAATRLARTLAPVSGGTSRACGRLCLVPAADRLRLADATRYLAPLVLDVGDPGEAPAAVAIAGTVILVGGPGVEPALATLVAESLSRVGPAPMVVCNRPADGAERWRELGAVELPDSRMGARLALAGREPHGELGRAVRRLTEICGSASSPATPGSAGPTARR